MAYFDRYIVTARYLRRINKKFIERLKAEGMYDDSIIVLYGDHYGISEKHNRAMAQFLEKDQITEFDTLNLQRTPLYIPYPWTETEGRTISKPTGQIDMKPTILNLLGIDTTNDIRFGHDMFSDEYAGFVVLRDGSFITDKYALQKQYFL